MNQKTLNIIFGIVIVILVVAVAYFAFGKKTEQLSDQNENVNAPLAEDNQNPTNAQGQNVNEPVVNSNTAQQPINTNTQPTPTGEFAGWKINKNPMSLPISYYYPANWQIQKKGNLITGAVGTVDYVVNFEVKEEPEYASLTPVNAYKKDGTFTKVDSEQNTSIANKVAYKVQGQASMGGGKYVAIEKIYISSNNKIYSTTFIDQSISSDITSSNSYSTYLKILSGLAFTK